VDVVLLEPQKSENIGAAARAMANTGLGRLILVRPRISKPELMEASATRQGRSRLSAAEIHSDLKSALAPYSLVAAASARGGGKRGVVYSPRRAAPLFLAANIGRAAILFGTERAGLSSADLRSAHLVVTIPTEDPENSSLNLAQSVLILGYELLLASGGEPPPPPVVSAAPFQDVDRALGDLEATLASIGFLPETNTGGWFMNVKKIFNRSLLTRGECDLIQGICRQIRYKTRAAEKERKGAPEGGRTPEGDTERGPEKGGKKDSPGG
jgi:tRNA/rRNA methyltransferase